MSWKKVDLDEGERLTARINHAEAITDQPHACMRRYTSLGDERPVIEQVCLVVRALVLITPEFVNIWMYVYDIFQLTVEAL